MNINNARYRFRLYAFEFMKVEEWWIEIPSIYLIIHEDEITICNISTHLKIHKEMIVLDRILLKVF